MSRGASFVPVQGAIWVIKVADGRGLLTRGMWGARTAYVPIGRYSMSAMMKGGVNRSTSSGWRGYRNQASREERAGR